MYPEQPIIPLCRSEFLQDFTIEFGRDVQKNRLASWSIRLDTVEVSEQSLERLAVWIWTWYSTRVNLTLWEDRTLWIEATLLATPNHPEYSEGFYPSADVLSHAEIVDALVQTANTSTRLCYHESLIPLMRKFWRFNGSVETRGNLVHPGETPKQ